MAAHQIKGDVLDGVGPLHSLRQTYAQLPHRERDIGGGCSRAARGHRNILAFQLHSAILLRAAPSVLCLATLLRQVDDLTLDVPILHWRLRHDSGLPAQGARTLFRSAAPTERVSSIEAKHGWRRPHSLIASAKICSWTRLMRVASMDFDPSIRSADLDDFNHRGVAESRHPGSTNF
nr:hypothetical protein [Bradyrhizobium diazoefficiens]